MDTTTEIVVAVIIVAIVVIAMAMRARKGVKLRQKFGPEYERTVDEMGGRRKAEAQLSNREKRVETFALQPLRAGERERYGVAWKTVQSEFVDEPAVAVNHADELLSEIMVKRGYPVGDFEQRAADLSVDHAVVVQNYRAAHEIALRHGRGEADTEDMRRAMIHYRTLFEDLVDEPATIHAKAS